MEFETALSTGSFAIDTLLGDRTILLLIVARYFQARAGGTGGTGRSSEAGEMPLHQMAALLGDLLQILSRHCNLPGSAAIIQDLSAADPSSAVDVHQVNIRESWRKWSGGEERRGGGFNRQFAIDA